MREIKKQRRTSIWAIALGLSISIFNGSALAEVGVTDTEIRLGRSAPMSGPSGYVGKSAAMGFKLYFDKINADGGIHGRKIKVIEYDDKYEPENCIKNTDKLLNTDKVFAVFGYIGTPNIKAVLPTVRSSGRPFLFPRTGEPALTNPFDRKIFNFKPSTADEMEALIEEVLTKRKKTRIAIVTQSDSLGSDIRASVTKAMRKRGHENFLVDAPVERNSASIEAAFKAVEAVNPDVVVMAAASGSQIPFVKMSSAKGKNWLHITASSMVGVADLAKDLGNLNFMISMTVPDPGSSKFSDRPLSKQFKKDFAQVKDASLSEIVAFEAYLQAALITEGLRRAGRELSIDSLVKGYESGEIDVGGFQYRWTETDHTGKLPLYVREVDKKNVTDL